MLMDDPARRAELDSADMWGAIAALPEQLEAAWRLGQTLPLPAWRGITRVVIAGMGGSAMGGDLLAAYAADRAGVPLVVWRDYGLPAWARGPETLVVTASHSGETEETLSAYELARGRDCRLVALTTGGTLAAQAAAHGSPRWQFEHGGQPRAALGWGFGLAAAALARLGLLGDWDGAAELATAAAAMRAQAAGLGPDVVTVRNPAKRLAGQCEGRSVILFGSGMMAAAARRWKTQLNELAKSWAQVEALPEANHNSSAGTQFPEDLGAHTMALFLRAPSDHPRNRLRADLTRQMFLLDGLAVDAFDAPGATALAQLWTAVHFGDFVAYYLALACGVDPTPVDAIQQLKDGLRAQTH
jgi:glucose/mannose-6-phosphate isomerase